MAERDPEIRLGDHTERAEAFVTRGNFESIDHVVEAALDALDRQERDFNDKVHAKVAEALADPRPGVPMEEAFVRIRAAVRARYPE